MPHVPGGWKSINYTLKVAGKVGVNNFIQSIRAKNTCKVCAYGMGGQRGGMVNELNVICDCKGQEPTIKNAVLTDHNP